MITNFSTLCLHLWSDRRQIRPLGCGGGRQINSSWFGLGFQRGVKVTKDFILLTIVSILDQNISASKHFSIHPVQSEICLTIRSIFNVHCVAYIVPPKKESVKCNFVHNCTQKKRPSVTASPHPRKMSSSRQFHPGQNAINFVYDFFQCQTGGPFLSMPACSLAAF